MFNFIFLKKKKRKCRLTYIKDKMADSHDTECGDEEERLGGEVTPRNLKREEKSERKDNTGRKKT